MNYISGNDRKQVRIETYEDHIESDCEVGVIDKVVDALDIQSLGFRIGSIDIYGRPMFDSKDMLKLFVYVHFNGIMLKLIYGVQKLTGDFVHELMLNLANRTINIKILFAILIFTRVLKHLLNRKRLVSRCMESSLVL